MTVHTKLPPLPEGMRWANTEVEEDGFFTKDGIVPRRWAGDPGVIAFIAENVKLPYKDRQ